MPTKYDWGPGAYPLDGGVYELTDGVWFCTLCGKNHTGSHPTCQMHITNLGWYLGISIEQAAQRVQHAQPQLPPAASSAGAQHPGWNPAASSAGAWPSQPKASAPPQWAIANAAWHQFQQQQNPVGMQQQPPPPGIPTPDGAAPGDSDLPPPLRGVLSQRLTESEFEERLDRIEVMLSKVFEILEAHADRPDWYFTEDWK